MPLILWNPLRWDWSHFANFTWPERQAPMPYISDKIARDIGLDANELAKMRHVWPSESPDRPRI